MRSFRNLKVWAKAHAVTMEVYRLTRAFPLEERYGLTSQMRRCAVSIPSNIAEGCGRGTDTDFARFLQIAAGSSSELEYQVLLAHELGLLSRSTSADLSEAICEVRRMLNGLIKNLTADR
ncbi:four helix bundle protein [Rhodothermaceae bacterium RA]|nr:four helix bundle protein [Rhodothermaceae bacterium RA]